MEPSSGGGCWKKLWDLLGSEDAFPVANDDRWGVTLEELELWWRNLVMMKLLVEKDRRFRKQCAVGVFVEAGEALHLDDVYLTGRLPRDAVVEGGVIMCTPTLCPYEEHHIDWSGNLTLVANTNWSAALEETAEEVGELAIRELMGPEVVLPAVVKGLLPAIAEYFETAWELTGDWCGRKIAELIAEGNVSMSELCGLPNGVGDYVAELTKYLVDLLTPVLSDAESVAAHIYRFFDLVFSDVSDAASWVVNPWTILGVRLVQIVCWHRRGLARQQGVVELNSSTSIVLAATKEGRSRRIKAVKNRGAIDAIESRIAPVGMNGQALLAMDVLRETTNGVISADLDNIVQARAANDISSALKVPLDKTMFVPVTIGEKHFIALQRLFPEIPMQRVTTTSVHEVQAVFRKACVNRIRRIVGDRSVCLIGPSDDQVNSFDYVNHMCRPILSGRDKARMNPAAVTKQMQSITCRDRFKDCDVYVGGGVVGVSFFSTGTQSLTDFAVGMVRKGITEAYVVTNMAPLLLLKHVNEWECRRSGLKYRTDRRRDVVYVSQAEDSVNGYVDCLSSMMSWMESRPKFAGYYVNAEKMLGYGALQMLKVTVVEGAPEPIPRRVVLFDQPTYLIPALTKRLGKNDYEWIEVIAESFDSVVDSLIFPPSDKPIEELVSSRVRANRSALVVGSTTIRRKWEMSHVEFVTIVAAASVAIESRRLQLSYMRRALSRLQTGRDDNFRGLFQRIVSRNIRFLTRYDDSNLDIDSFDVLDIDSWLVAWRNPAKANSTHDWFRPQEYLDFVDSADSDLIGSAAFAPFFTLKKKFIELVDSIDWSDPVEKPVEGKRKIRPFERSATKPVALESLIAEDEEDIGIDANERTALIEDAHVPGVVPRPSQRRVPEGEPARNEVAEDEEEDDLGLVVDMQEEDEAERLYHQIFSTSEEIPLNVTEEERAEVYVDDAFEPDRDWMYDGSRLLEREVPSSGGGHFLRMSIPIFVDRCDGLSKTAIYDALFECHRFGGIADWEVDISCFGKRRPEPPRGASFARIVDESGELLDIDNDLIVGVEDLLYVGLLIRAWLCDKGERRAEKTSLHLEGVASSGKTTLMAEMFRRREPKKLYIVVPSRVLAQSLRKLNLPDTVVVTRHSLPYIKRGSDVWVDEYYQFSDVEIRAIRTIVAFGGGRLFTSGEEDQGFRQEGRAEVTKENTDTIKMVSVANAVPQNFAVLINRWTGKTMKTRSKVLGELRRYVDPKDSDLAVMERFVIKSRLNAPGPGALSATTCQGLRMEQAVIRLDEPDKDFYVDQIGCLYVALTRPRAAALVTGDSLELRRGRVEYTSLNSRYCELTITAQDPIPTPDAAEIVMIDAVANEVKKTSDFVPEELVTAEDVPADAPEGNVGQLVEYETSFKDSYDGTVVTPAANQEIIMSPGDACEPTPATSIMLQPGDGRLVDRQRSTDINLSILSTFKRTLSKQVVKLTGGPNLVQSTARKVVDRFFDLSKLNDLTGSELAMWWSARRPTQRAQMIGAEYVYGEVARTVTYFNFSKTQDKVKTSLEKIFKEGYGQGIESPDPAYLLQMGAESARLLYALSSGLKKGVFVDVGHSFNDMAEVFRMDGHHDNLAEVTGWDVGAQDSSHCAFTNDVFVEIAKLLGCDGEKLRLYREMRRATRSKPIEQQGLRYIIEETLASGDPFTLFSNCIELMIIVELNLVKEYRTIKIKGDNLELNGGQISPCTHPMTSHIKINVEYQGYSAFAGTFGTPNNLVVDFMKMWVKMSNRCDVSEGGLGEMFTALRDRDLRIPINDFDYVMTVAAQHYGVSEGEARFRFYKVMSWCKSFGSFIADIKPGVLAEYVCDPIDNCWWTAIDFLCPKTPVKENQRRPGLSAFELEIFVMKQYPQLPIRHIRSKYSRHLIQNFVGLQIFNDHVVALRSTPRSKNIQTKRSKINVNSSRNHRNILEDPKHVDSGPVAKDVQRKVVQGVAFSSWFSQTPIGQIGISAADRNRQNEVGRVRNDLSSRCRDVAPAPVRSGGRNEDFKDDHAGGNAGSDRDDAGAPRLRTFAPVRFVGSQAQSGQSRNLQ